MHAVGVAVAMPSQMAGTLAAQRCARGDRHRRGGALPRTNTGVPPDYGRRPSKQERAPSTRPVLGCGRGGRLRDLGSDGYVRAIAATSTGGAYVSNGDFVTAFDPTGAQTAQWPSTYENLSLSGIAVSPTTGHVFVAEQNYREVIELTPGLTEVRRWPATVSTPWGLAADAAGDLYASSPFTYPYVVTKFHPDGTQVGSFVPGGELMALSVVGSHLWGGGFSEVQRIDLAKPVAALSRDKAPRTTQNVTFDARNSYLPFASITRCQFDLDGDGSYETDNGGCTAARRFDDSGTFTVRVRVTGSTGGTDEAAVTVPVTASSAALSAPSQVLTGATAAFDASGSALPDASIERYDWDLDGDGSFETSTGTSPRVDRSYGTPGGVDVGVRVTRVGGVVDTTSAHVTVFPAPPGGPIGVSINNGAVFTKDPNVRLNLVWPAFTDSALVANDGGFAGARSVSVAPSMTWHLTQSGPERLPKTVYLRYGGTTQTFQDDIILDQTPPTVVATAPATALSAAAGSVRRRTVIVRVTAKDKTSGIARLQLGTTRKAKLTIKRNATTIKAKGFTPRYVRAQDRAGNWSKWRAIAKRTKKS
jgi:hypothetical protein